MKVWNQRKIQQYEAVTKRRRMAKLRHERSIVTVVEEHVGQHVDEGSGALVQNVDEGSGALVQHVDEESGALVQNVDDESGALVQHVGEDTGGSGEPVDQQQNRGKKRPRSQSEEGQQEVTGGSGEQPVDQQQNRGKKRPRR